MLGELAQAAKRRGDPAPTFTVDEAQLVSRINQAAPKILAPFALLYARMYLQRRARGEPTTDLDLRIAEIAATGESSLGLTAETLAVAASVGLVRTKEKRKNR